MTVADSELVHVLPGDTDEIDAFTEREWPRHDAHLGIRWEPIVVTLAARTGDALIGAARMMMVGGVCELKQILVSLDHAKRGIGSRLLSAVETRAREAGCHKMRLETADYQARPFYERHGFRCVCTLEDDRFHRGVHVMEKPLSSAAAG